jgi:predicted Zn-dependent peptidase
MYSIFDSEEIEKSEKSFFRNMDDEGRSGSLHPRSLLQNFWKGHPLGRSVLGTEKRGKSDA